MDKSWDDMKRVKEEEYFMKKEKETLQKKKEEQKALEENKTRELAHMRCPKCGAPLKEISFQKILIDQCTACSGVWLDPGELETIAEEDQDGFFSRFFKSKP